MDATFWTRLHGRLRRSALALGTDAIVELADLARIAAAPRVARTPKRTPRRRTR